jgi:hypothetical protein
LTRVLGHRRLVTAREEREAGAMAGTQFGTRVRWLAILLVAIPMPLACDSGAEESGPTSSAPTKILSPEGFSAAPEGFSVVLSWSAPTGSAKIVGYEVRRNGKPLEAISADETTLTDFDVGPGRSYTYEIRSHGPGGFSDPLSTDARIAVPPLRAARLEGDFGVKAKVVDQSGYTKFEGSTFGWQFRPKCGKGPCNVVWRDVTDKHMHALLKRKQTRYSGSYTGLFLVKCGGTRSTSNVELSLKVVKARAIAGEWRATKLTGTLSSSESAQFGCVGSHAVQSVKGKLRIAG